MCLSTCADTAMFSRMRNVAISALLNISRASISVCEAVEPRDVSECSWVQLVSTWLLYNGIE